MKRFLLLLSLSPCLVFSQTALIFHKSHSGSAAVFAASRLGNFGEPPTVLRQVILLNDSTVIMRNQQMGYSYSDTIVNSRTLTHPVIPADSVRKLFGEEVEVINFPEKPVYTPPPGQEHLPPLGIPDEQGKKHKKKKRKERRSDLLWLALIGGGTFLGSGLLFRAVQQRPEQVVHA